MMDTSKYLDVVFNTTTRGRERRESGFSEDFYPSPLPTSPNNSTSKTTGNFRRESYDSGLSASPSPVQPMFHIDLDNKLQELDQQQKNNGSSSKSGSSDLTAATSPGGSSSSCKSSPPRRKKKKKRLCESLSGSHFEDVYKLTGEVLGEGSYGRVESCVHIMSGLEYAVKIISKRGYNFSRPKILKEIELYYLCQGRREIIQMVEYFEEANEFFLVFEKAKGGPLLDQIQRRVHFTEQEAAAIIRDLASALAFLHGKGIAHRDLKPENVLCINDGEDFLPIKLCDFDLCSAVYQTISTPQLQSPVGSVEYMAPEVVEAFAYDMDIFDDDDDSDLELTYDKRCDLWSLGIIAYILLCGYLPFNGHCGRDCGWEDRGEECQVCQHQLFLAIKSGKLEFPEENWSEVSAQAKDLISKLLVRNASQRIDASSVLEHPWIASGGNCKQQQSRRPQLPLSEEEGNNRQRSVTRALDTPHVLRRRHRSVHDLFYAEAAALQAMKDNWKTPAAAATPGAVPPSNPSSPMKKSATVIEFQKQQNVTTTPTVTTTTTTTPNMDIVRRKNQQLSLYPVVSPAAAPAAADSPPGMDLGALMRRKAMRRQTSLIVFPEDLASSGEGCRWEF